MILQVQRVSDYHRYLAQLLSLTSRDHPDYQHIRVTVARTDEVMTINIFCLLIKSTLILFYFSNIRLFKLELMS